MGEVGKAKKVRMQSFGVEYPSQTADQRDCWDCLKRSDKYHRDQA